MSSARAGPLHYALKVSSEQAVTLYAIGGIPLVARDDDLVSILARAIDREGLALQDGDVLVIAQKIVSKAEGRLVDLRDVRPSVRARLLSRRVGSDPRLVEVILGESRQVLRAAPGVLVVETHAGFCCANAGVDRSNVGPDADIVALLPADPDASARRIRDGLQRASGRSVAVIINDSHGRPWRNGTVGVAIGAAGIAAIADLRGRRDLFGRTLKATTVGQIDELAAAASLLMGGADEGRPAVLIRGVCYTPSEGGAGPVIRARERDLFR